jgi:hypothetical protein
MTRLVCEFKEQPHHKLTPQSIAPYLREYGISRMARETRFSRGGLTRAFGPKGNPRLDMLFAVINKLHIHTCFSIRETPSTTKEEQ